VKNRVTAVCACVSRVCTIARSLPDNYVPSLGAPAHQWCRPKSRIDPSGFLCDLSLGASIQDCPENPLTVIVVAWRKCDAERSTISSLLTCARCAAILANQPLLLLRAHQPIEVAGLYEIAVIGVMLGRIISG
jgi:hypothetical protein